MTPFNVEELLQNARAKTGLDDFGPSDFREALEAFIASINEQGEINDQRRERFSHYVDRMLVNRLWFAKDMKDHPEIDNEEISPPVIIVSLPRTGSTKLHRMLGASGDFQVLQMWRAHMFARIPGLPDGGRARRIAETRDHEKWMYEVSPEVVTGHPMFTDEAEEDMLLGEASFRDGYIVGQFHTPSYAQWLAQADQQPKFDYFLQQIKYLQWQEKPQSAKPWLFKTPIHLGNEEFLSQTYKSPRFIFTHRDPVKCMPSIANPVSYMRKMYSDHDTTSELGGMLTGMWSQKALAHLKWREANPDVQVLDLSMKEITNDGPGTARKVYDFLGMTLSTNARDSMRDWECQNPIEKHGKNTYTAQGFGTTDADIREAFAPYIDRYADFL